MGSEDQFSDRWVSERGKPLILLVDDDPTQRILGQEYLLRWNYRVVIAKDGREGLQRARSLRPDLMILDVKMPYMDGYSLCREIRSDPDIENSPIIIATGLDDAESIERGFDAGATDFVTKPIKWPLLAHRLKFILRVNRMEHDLRSAKREAEMVSNAKSRFIANVSHELRTPLNSIIGFSEMLNSEIHGSLGKPEYANYSNVIHESGLHLLDIINDILEIAKCEAGTVTLKESEVCISEIVEAAVRQLTPRAQQNSVRLINDVPMDLPLIHADELRFRQILLNLVTNAVKFNRKDGEVRIATTLEPGGDLTISVTDTGVGIAETDIVRIMQPFQQAGEHLAQSFEGAGLGVAIASEFSKLHGAELRYSSRLGEGTTVSLIVPRSRILPSVGAQAGSRIA